LKVAVLLVWVRALVGFTLIALVGCATQQASLAPQPLDAFARSGRFALRVEEPLSPTQAVQGGFSWRDANGRLELDLINPFGNILARIEVTGKRAVLTQSNGTKLEALTPEELVKTAVGEAIPVKNLRTWLRSQTSVEPAMTRVTRDEQGRVASFEQAGWRVELSRFDASGPRLLVLSRQDDAKKIVIRLVVDGT
jgi:outer membrane lipoprotein LolB